MMPATYGKTYEQLLKQAYIHFTPSAANAPPGMRLGLDYMAYYTVVTFPRNITPSSGVWLPFILNMDQYFLSGTIYILQNTCNVSLKVELDTSMLDIRTHDLYLIY